MNNSKTCNMCGKIFTRPSHLKHHKEKKKPCVAELKKCEYCDKTFSRKSAITRHLKDNVCKKENEPVYMNRINNLEMELFNQKKIIDEKLKEIEDKKIVNITNNKTNNNNINNNGDNVNNLNMIVITKDYIVRNFVEGPIMTRLQNYDDVRKGNAIKDKEQNNTNPLLADESHFEDIGETDFEEDGHNFMDNDGPNFMDDDCDTKENNEPNFMDDDSDKEDSTDTENIAFVDKIIFKYTRGNLIKYIGNIIVSFYKKEDDIPAQTFWCSDVPRLKFLVRILTISAGKKWFADSAGLLVTKDVVRPLLEYIIKCIQKQVSCNTTDIINNPDKYITLGKIIMALQDENMENHITRQIAPSFIVGKHLEMQCTV